MVFSHNFRHQYSHLVRRIEFSCLFTGICCKVTDKVFIYIPQHVIVLASIGRYIFYQFDQILQCTCLRCGIFAQFTQSGL